jgi:DNA repair exonuclease SbcCD ATPase subunit
LSFYNTYKSWGELREFLQKINPPQCFTVNYLPKENEYAIWIGNQPYYSYEKLIELEQKEKAETRELNRKLTKQNLHLNSEIKEILIENQRSKGELDVLKVEFNNSTLSNYRLEQQVNNYKYENEQLKEVYKDREDDIDFYVKQLKDIVEQIETDYTQEEILIGEDEGFTMLLSVIYQIAKGSTEINEFD